MIFGRKGLNNMGKKSLKHEVFNGMFWRFGEQISSQLASFIISIVLARLLTPKEYGVVAIMMVFISIANVFITEGFGSALIQKKKADNIDFSSVFFFNFFFSWVVYLVVFVLAPIIAHFYKLPILTNAMRVLALVLPISGINSIQQSYVSRKMIFQRFFWSSLVGTILSGIIGIIMAYNKMGIWALVGQQISSSLINTLVLWFTVKWRPIFVFEFDRLKELLSFGWKMLVTNLINTLYDNLRSLIMGKVYSSTDLAYYNRGMNYPSLIVSNITISISSVLFPAMSKIQDDKKKMKTAIKDSIAVSTYLLFPMMAGLAAVATNLISIMLTDKWLPAVPYMRIACIYFALYPINITNLQAMNAIGRSDIYLKLSIIKKSIGIICILISIPFGPYAMAASEIFVGIFAILVNVYPNKKLFNYTLYELGHDCFKNLIMSILLFIIVYLSQNWIYIIPNRLVVLLIQIIIGVISYIGLSILFKSREYKYILDVLKKH